MNILENIKTALGAIAANKLRAFLTMLGVIIGVYAVSTMIALGQLATGKITGELNEIGGSQIAVSPDWEIENPEPFTQDDVSALTRAGLPIRNISTESVALQAASEKSKGTIQINGTTASYPEDSGEAKISEGRYFSEAEAKSSAPVIVLNQQAADKYFPNSDPIGKTLRLTKTINYADGSSDFQRAEFTVIGITKPLSSALGMGTMASGYVPLNYVWRYYGTPGEYGSLMLKVQAEAADSQHIKEAISRILEARRGVKDFQVQSFDQFLDQFKSITGAMQAMLASIGGLSLLVGGIGIMNIMLVSVTERTREIGLRKALGARRRTILGQFLIEAVMLTGLGGLIGYGLSVLTVWIASKALPQFFGGGAVLSLSVAILAIGVSALVGLIFGVWPARRAANLTPIEALRYE